MAGRGYAHLRSEPRPAISVCDLDVRFRAGRGRFANALSSVSLDVLPGETLGLVGESGCGKSTLARTMLGIVRPRAGVISLDGVSLGDMPARRRRMLARSIQMVFQDPVSSLHPRRTVIDLVREPLDIWRVGRPDQRRHRVDDLLAGVGLDPAIVGDRRAGELSGGQCQRVSIARALALEPGVLICDETVSALDVSVQAQILNLLNRLKRELGLTMLFVSHDLAVIKNVSDRVVVMYLGKVCEVGDSQALLRSPAHPYSAMLVEAVPVPDPHRPLAAAPASELPSNVDPPSGCRFRTRCERADGVCAEQEPVIRAVGDDHFVACHHPLVEPLEGPDTQVAS